MVLCVDRYQKTELIEITSHSLFSEWFSEVRKLDQIYLLKISEMLDDVDIFVIVLIGKVNLLNKPFKINKS